MSSFDGLYMFEQVCEAYIWADQEHQRKALELLPEDERKTFLQGVALYRLFTDPAYYREMCEAMAETIFKEFRGEK